MIFTTSLRPPVPSASPTSPRPSPLKIALWLALGLAGGFGGVHLVLQLYPIH